MALQVELVSPERILFSGQADMVIARTIGGGDIAFMEGHAPFVGALEVATATITVGSGGDQEVAVHGGFVEVTSEPSDAASDAGAGAGATEGSTPAAGGRTVVTILSDVAELSGEIDVLRAQSAKERAQAKLNEDREVEAEAALRRANVRLAAAGAL